MSVGDRCLRLYERLGSVVGYVVVVLICLPITLPLAGVAHLIAVIIALHVAAALGKRGARIVAHRRFEALVIEAPDRLPAEVVAQAAQRSDPQELVRAIARLPLPARSRWLEIAGALPHRCGTTVRSEVERQGGATGDAGLRELESLAARLDWTAQRPIMRALAFAPSAAWILISVVAIADWPAPGESLLFGLASLFLVIGVLATIVMAARDEVEGHRAAVAPAAVDW